MADSMKSDTTIRSASPRFAQLNDDLLVGDVWSRTVLGMRDKCVLTFAALIAANRAADLKVLAPLALDNGATPLELGEIIAHLSFYCGWPMATSAAQELARVFENRGIVASEVAQLDEPLLTLEPDAEAARKNTVAKHVAPTSALLARDTDEVLFADLWRRPELAPRDRSLITVAALIAMGQAEQMEFHLNRAMENGLTESEVGAVLSHLAYYVGWPRAMSAVGVARRILDGRKAV